MSTQSENSQHSADAAKRAVILLNFGGPKSLDQVRPFLKGILGDKAVMGWFGRLGTKLAFNAIAEKSIERYKAIGGSSPLVEITLRQAAALQEKLKSKGKPFRVYAGMRYSPPSIEDALLEAIFDGAKEFMVVPLYPHYSMTTTGSAFAEFARVIKKLIPGAGGDYVASYESHHGYIKAVAAKVRAQVEEVISGGEDPAIIFSAHSLPGKLARKDARYLTQIQATAGLVARTVGLQKFEFAYQSGRKGWLGPTVGETVRKLAREGRANIVVVPLSFTCDNIETLYDIDIELKAQAKELEVNLRRTESLNDSPEFIAALADIVIGAGAGQEE